jgi:hypothetical protein
MEMETKGIDMNKTQFIKRSQHAKLAAAVIRQCGGWEAFVNMAHDLERGGIDGGFHGFIYTAETVAFTQRNRQLIQDLAKSQAEVYGWGIIDMIKNFGCFRNDKPTEHDVATALYGGRKTDGTDNVMNALAWYAGEEIAREYRDLLEAN